MDQSRLLINNEWVDSGSGETIDIYSPWDDTVCGTVQAATKEQALSAIEAADHAFTTWRRTSVAGRVEMMRKAIDLIRADKPRIVSLLGREIGKHDDAAESEFERSLGYAELAIEALRHMKGSIYAGDVTGQFERGRKPDIIHANHWEWFLPYLRLITRLICRLQRLLLRCLQAILLYLNRQHRAL
ncbi:MAG: putative aldehyde dehydrogenase [candidate division WS6 bacterium OLB20]|uniref:Putative aldehyde dehydrogenase n=1 Tax=candidate division WS6 bacterium OLB20 TaxID=1617426 RepID=A0A136LZZ6_9BACT|nr:MAG: putative aldehyde dehydrogenase [candidate division WS6 bacterium OLB20]